MATPESTDQQKYNVDEQGYSVLYKGQSGTGKTYNMLSWPGPIAIACTDKNMRTLREAIKAGVDVEPYIIRDWKDFADAFAPAVVNRELEVTTVAVDTIDMLGVLLQRDLQGPRARLTQADWGTMLNRWIDVVGGMVETTINSGGQRYYNILMSVHTRDVTDDGGSLLKVAPHLGGAFKDMVEGFFDWVLLCDAEVKSSKDASGKPVMQKNYFVHTVPPRYHTCKGGGLPPKVEGTYPALMKAETELR